MLSLVPKTIEHYAIEHSRAVPDLLEELRQYTLANTDLPQMQVGAIEGNFLKCLVRMIGAKRVLEVGTFTGYSALMMASGLPDEGELITCEISQKNAAIAQAFFDRSDHGHKITIALGPATKSIATLKAPFDMAFIDADKAGYLNYFKTIKPLMRKGGLMVIDNVLWSGRVLEGSAAKEESTRALSEFNAYIQSQAALDHVMLTVRDGMTLIVV